MFKDNRNLGSNAFQDFRGGNQAKFLRGRIIMIQKSGAIIPPMFDKNMTHNSARMMKTMHIILQDKEHFSINKKNSGTFFLKWSVDRVYVSRYNGGRGAASVETSARKEENNIAFYVKKSTEQF